MVRYLGVKRFHRKLGACLVPQPSPHSRPITQPQARLNFGPKKFASSAGHLRCALALAS